MTFYSATASSRSSAPPSPKKIMLTGPSMPRCQQAKSLELRAAMSLSRLWQGPGKRQEARQLLAKGGSRCSRARSRGDQWVWSHAG